MVGRFILLFVSGLVCSQAIRAQVVFTSPLPFGILQVHGSHADLRLNVQTSHQAFWIKLSSDTDTSPIDSGWTSLAVHNGTVDTLLTVPASLLNYALYWRTGLDTTDTSGVIPNLTPGHIIGVAGQSNAVGWVWPPADSFVAVRNGDIRMLANDIAWQPAEEPTVPGAAQGPWIVMADSLYAHFSDSLPIGIVNTAVGGTGLTGSIGVGRWKKNSSDTMDKMYPDALDRFRHAGSELDYFTWIQGEADGETGTLADPNVYREQFSELIADFESDLNDTFSVFHSQISGYSGNSWPASYPEAREANRILPPSTLVGTAVGRSIWDGAFHYTINTYRAIGKMFADAVLKERYGISVAGLYPPVMPDSIATLDSVTDGSIPSKYCISMTWNRAGRPVSLVSVRPDQYFQIHSGTVPFDTSLVSYRIDPKNPSRTQVWMDSIPLTLDTNWYLTYDGTAGGELAPLATIDPVTGDTIFATAFYKIPVRIAANPPASVQSFEVQNIAPVPAAGTISCELFSPHAEKVTLTMSNVIGRVLLCSELELSGGVQYIPIDVSALVSGAYWIEFRGEDGTVSTRKFMVSKN